MAIQANMYPENLGLPISSSQDYFFVENNNIDMNYINNNNLLYNGCLQQQQLQYQQQQQQQQEYLFHLQNMNKRNSYINNNSFMFSQPSKKQKLATTTATTASTTTSESDTNNNRNHNHNHYNNNDNNNISMGCSRSFFAEVEKQSQEIDRFVTLQNERLRLALQEQRRQQMVTIIKKIEAKALQILQQKDEQIIEATKKSMEFQQIVEKLQLENQVWQKVALENEAMVETLNNTLEQLKQQNQQVEDQEDVCSSSSNCVVDEKEDTSKFQETTEKGNLDLCKMCKSRKMCVVILPCRHLCCCSVCDAVTVNCPVCNSPKMASIEVFMA